MSREELLALPVSVDLVTAARALGMGRTKAYELVRRGEFPLPVVKLGNRQRVVTEYLLRFLGVERHPPTPPGAPSCEHDWHVRRMDDMQWSACFLCGKQTDYTIIREGQ